jgi:flagellar L-ring protein precursor FlgH
LIEDHKARRRGDTITILIVESASASKQASTDTSRSSSASAGMPNLLGLEKSGSLNSWMDLSKLINASFDSKFAGSGSTSRKESLTATISAKVMDVLPNGNFQIEGRRNVKVNNEDQSIKVEGTVRPRDIAADNTISSSLIADARITYTGKGIVSDQQSPGWLVNILNKIWPF